MDGRLMMGGEQVSEALDALVALVNQRVVSARKDVLSFHAAAVSVDDAAILAPAASGSGKSTLCAALLGAGADYLSDESVGVGPDGDLLGYPKPLGFKAGSRKYFSDLDLGPYDVDPGRQSVWHVPAHVLGGRAVGSAGPGLVAAPRFVDGADVDIAPLPAHLAAEALITQAQNLATYGLPSALQVVGALVSRVPAVRVTFGDARLAAAPLLRVLANSRQTRVARTFSVAGPPRSSPNSGGADVVAPTHDVHSLRFDDGGVLVRAESGTMVTVDFVGMHAWAMLAEGRRTMSAVVDSLAERFDASRSQIDSDVGHWVELLMMHGFVRLTG